jgi:hypothetical protein
MLIFVTRFLPLAVCQRIGGFELSKKGTRVIAAHLKVMPQRFAHPLACRLPITRQPFTELFV